MLADVEEVAERSGGAEDTVVAAQAAGDIPAVAAEVVADLRRTAHSPTSVAWLVAALQQHSDRYLVIDFAVSMPPGVPASVPASASASRDSCG